MTACQLLQSSGARMLALRIQHRQQRERAIVTGHWPVKVAPKGFADHTVVSCLASLQSLLCASIRRHRHKIVLVAEEATPACSVFFCICRQAMHLHAHFLEDCRHYWRRRKYTSTAFFSFIPVTPRSLLGGYDAGCASHHSCKVKAIQLCYLHFSPPSACGVL